MNREAIMSYDEIVAELQKLETLSKGKMTLETIGYTGEGRPMYATTIGVGDIRMRIQGNVHGNESYGAEASLQILETLVSNGSPDVEEALSEMTFMIIPSCNPDGREAYHRDTVVGNVNLNRDWGDPAIKAAILASEDWPYTPVPMWQAVESKNAWYTWADFKPHYLIDIHHQGTFYLDDETNEVTHVSLGTAGALYGGGNIAYANFVDPDVLAEARRMTLVAYAALSERTNANPSPYPTQAPDPAIPPRIPGSPGAASMLGCRGPNGEDAEWATSALLIELSRGIGQKSRDDVINYALVASWAIIDSIATGKIEGIDPDGVHDLVPRGDRITTSDKFPTTDLD
jgi:hypothetical protein